MLYYFGFLRRFSLEVKGLRRESLPLTEEGRWTDLVCDSDRSITEGRKHLQRGSHPQFNDRSIICNNGQHPGPHPPLLLLLSSFKHQIRNRKRKRNSQKSSIAQIRISNIESASTHRIRPFIHAPSPSQIIYA